MATVATDPAELTTRQREILTFLYEFTREYGYQPSIREMMARFGINGPNGIECHLIALARKGWLERRGESRGLRFLRRPDGHRFDGFAEKEVS